MTARAERAVTDVVAVETLAPGLVRVVTWGDAYPVDARDAGCNCPDKLHNDAEVCKHEYAAILATTGGPTPFTVSDNLSERVATDGGDEECPDCHEELPCFEHYELEDDE